MPPSLRDDLVWCACEGYEMDVRVEGRPMDLPSFKGAAGAILALQKSNYFQKNTGEIAKDVRGIFSNTRKVRLGDHEDVPCSEGVSFANHSEMSRFLEEVGVNG